MLDGSGEFNIGALAAKSLASSSLHLGIKKRTRSDVLAYCRALETQGLAALKTGAEALIAQDRDRDMVAYILEWS